MTPDGLPITAFSCCFSGLASRGVLAKGFNGGGASTRSMPASNTSIVRIWIFTCLPAHPWGLCLWLMTDAECIPALKALGQPVRMRIIRLLLKEHLSVNDIAARLRMPQYKVSRHLQVLRKAGLLEMNSYGKEHLHKIPTKQLAHRKSTLDLGCCTFRFDKRCG